MGGPESYGDEYKNMKINNRAMNGLPAVRITSIKYPEIYCKKFIYLAKLRNLATIFAGLAQMYFTPSVPHACWSRPNTHIYTNTHN